MTYHVDIQHACTENHDIHDEKLRLWAHAVLKTQCETAELTLRLVEEDEITSLNHTYRKQNKATNVLAFESHLPDNIELDSPFLGDVVICPSVLYQESKTLNQPLENHWAHIVVHGILHLFGFDHLTAEEAEIMRAKEISVLHSLGFDNPYIKDEHLE